MNRVTVFMFALFLLMAATGVAILWAAVSLNAWQGMVIGLAYIAFCGAGAAFAWRVRHEA